MSTTNVPTQSAVASRIPYAGPDNESYRHRHRCPDPSHGAADEYNCQGFSCRQTFVMACNRHEEASKAEQ